MFRTAITTVTLCAVALAQKAASPTFEVASIKPAAPQEMGRMITGMSGGPGTRDPAQVSFTNATVKMILTQAYDVKDFQVTGPSFLDTERFDITAKIAPGTSKADFRLMLQNLLAERFKVVLHKESKEAPTYALVVTKGGPKMKESEKINPAAGDAPPPTIGKDGRPQMGRGGRGMWVMMGPKGLHLQAVHSTMDLLCNMLSNQLGRPVADMTGLKAEYDYTLDFSPEGLGGMPGMGPGPLGGKEGPGGGPEGAVSIFTALQDLGLKLETRKGAVDLIIVDRALRTPTEN